MILVDTNVFTALSLERPIAPVASWFNAQRRTDLWTTTITIFELARGVPMTKGLESRKRRAEPLHELLSLLEDRILAVDRQSVLVAAEIAGRRHWDGVSIGLADTLLAGIAVAQKATLATRNVKDFDDLNITLIDPWNSSPNNPWSFPAIDGDA